MMMAEIVSRLWLMSMQACVLILIVLIARAALKKYPKIYSYMLWVLVGMRLLCPVLVESPLSLQPAPERVLGTMQDYVTGGAETSDIPVVDGQPALPPKPVVAQPAEGNGAMADATAAKAGIQDGIGAVGTSSAKTGKASVLMIAYLMGVIIISGFYLMQYLLMRRRVSTAVRSEGNVWYCDKITSPFVMGIFRTRIFLPYGLTDLEKYYVLKHERTHIRHHDSVILFLGILCLCLHWWNPLVWLAVHKMNQDMEMFCDEAALKGSHVQERKSYARVLLAFAARQNGFSLELAFGESDTERRVKNLMRRRRRSVGIVFLVILLALFCVIALLTVRGSESSTQFGGNGTQSGERDTQPDGSGKQPDMGNIVPDGKDSSIPEETADDSKERDEAYRTALMNVLYDDVFPDGVECDLYGGRDSSGNYFAIFDIDDDGREELLIHYTTASMAGMREAVYDYDGETGTMREELSTFPQITYYENGSVEAGWSHNQGLNAFSMDGFWPYDVYRYDSVTDTYVMIGMVDAWDKAISEQNYIGDPFPDEVDEDGDGILYSVMESISTQYSPNTLVDGPALAEWQESYRGDAAQIVVPWQVLTVENIYSALVGESVGAGGQNDGILFYGRWYVWNYQAAEISALSAEEMERYIGAELIYEENYVSVNGVKLEAPQFTYSWSIYTEETLVQEYQANLGVWWDGTEQVVCGEVDTKANDFGSHFFVVDDATIWIYHEGVFFQARREKPDTAVG